ncbi:MAG TPA: hypothetical protein VGF79_08320 [Bacteroidia bacterium]
MKHTFFFESGKDKITGNNDKLIILMEDIDIVIDSIRVIGYTDSVGRIEKNKKLAGKRIRSVVDFINPYLSSKPDIHTINRGERTINNDHRDRRVDVVVYYKKAILQITQNKEIVIDTNSTNCFKLAKTIIDYSKQDSIVIDNLKYMRLSTPFVPDFNVEYYYSNDGNTITRLYWVKYKRKESTFFKYYAVIPLMSYKKYRVFTLEPGPCHACHLNTTMYHPIIASKEVDYLKDKIVYKKIPFSRNKLLVRFQTHLISNANALSYMGQEVKWLKKSDDEYQYTKVRGEIGISEIYLGKFYIKAEWCDTHKYRPLPLNRGSNVPFCGGVRGGYNPRNLNIEIMGGYSPTNIWGGHIALKIDILNRLPDRFKASFLAGPNIDPKSPVYSALRMEYRIKRKEVYDWGRHLEWSNNTIKKKGELNFLIATEIKTRSTLMPGYGFSYFSFTYQAEKSYSLLFFLRGGMSYFNQEKSIPLFNPAVLFGINYLIIS